MAMELCFIVLYYHNALVWIRSEKLQYIGRYSLFEEVYMDKKEISYEIIDYSGITNVKFYTSTDNGSYIPSHWHRSVEILYQTKDPVKKTKLDMLKTTLEQLQIIDDIRPDGFILRFNSLIFELLFQLYHNFGVKIFQSDLSQQKKDLDRLNLVLNYISENYRYPISLDEIAGVAYLQTGYFCRFFKKKMGGTFLEYQNEYRLSFIYKDLINTKDPVHVILERHGFTNYKLFRRIIIPIIMSMLLLSGYSKADLHRFILFQQKKQRNGY